MRTVREFEGALVTRFWNFAEREFGDRQDLFDRFVRSPTRPPVFVGEARDHNLLDPPDAAPEVRRAIAACIPAKERHRHFGSMKSSQALAQSVFGSLVVLGKMGILSELTDDEGRPALVPDLAQARIELEHSVRHLGEPRPTSVDVWIEGDRRVAVECKLTEREFGRCSRPALEQGKDNNYASDYCDGSYTRQRERKERCSLSEIGVQYWKHLPELSRWPSDRDLRPCPLRGTYQLVRNVLAACVDSEGSVDADRGHALILYDARHPGFQPGGDAAEQWDAAVEGLVDPSVLRRCSWQRLVAVLDRCGELSWLVDGLAAKYGIEPATD